TFVCLPVTLHDCVLLKNFMRFNFRIRCIQTGIAPAFIFFVFSAVSGGTAKVGIFSGLPKNF
ncbi:hypothetical protein ACR78Z_21120, partial [Sphingobacterium thalpophilum]|uniref:hypothetical protein n=1 Tax=Sphingobacterium thalpophilum TaxID=259 RepID=UPI003DA58B89